MDGTPLLFDLPTLTTISRTRPPRRGSIQESILAFLTEPRFAKQIADHIQRAVPVATGQLRAMVRNGVVVRLGWGVYARRELCPDAPPPNSIKRNSPVKELVLVHARTATSLDDLAQRTGHSAAHVRGYLRQLRADGEQLSPVFSA